MNRGRLIGFARWINLRITPIVPRDPFWPCYCPFITPAPIHPAGRWQSGIRQIKSMVLAILEVGTAPTTW